MKIRLFQFWVGLSKDANDSRESASIYLTKSLIENNFNVKINQWLVKKMLTVTYWKWGLILI